MTKTKKITKAQVIAELSEIVDKYGADTLYHDRAKKTGVEARLTSGQPSCVYQNGKRTPACLIGVWLHEKHGVPVKVLRDFDRPQGDTGTGIDMLYRYDRTGLPEVTPAAVCALAVAQTRQDQRGTWGEALYAAKRASSR